MGVTSSRHKVNAPLPIPASATTNWGNRYFGCSGLLWLTQQEMPDAFNVFGCDIRKVVHSVYKSMVLLKEETMWYVKLDGRICYDMYNLEMVIAIAFWIQTKESMTFRRFVMGRLTTNHDKKAINLFFSLSSSRGRRVEN